MEQPVIQVCDLVKVYRGGQAALQGLTLEVWPGEIFCVVGPNGAGKTTLLRILATQLSPSSGAARVFGHDALKSPGAIRQRIAAVPQGGYPDGDLTPWEHVVYYLRARGVPVRAARAAAEVSLRDLDLWSMRGRPAALLSGGMARRVLLAMVLAAGADLIILDEPTVGLDPQVRRETWNQIASLKHRATILLTTHAMDEAEALADRVALISAGRVLAAGTPLELCATITAREKVLVAGSVEPDTLAGYGQVEVYAGKWVVYPHDGAALQGLVAGLLARGLTVQVQPTNLEDAYIACLRGQGAVAGRAAG